MNNNNQTSDLKCPNCDTNFVLIKDPDLEYEKCPNCNCIFLDKGELNILETGLAGDVETHFINIVSEKNNNKNINCPKCQVQMQKARFGNYAKIYFDFCSSCSGYFMTIAEEKQINDYLQSIRENKSNQEYRKYKNGVLVRVDIEENSLAMSGGGKMLISGYSSQNYLIISVFYQKPLEIDLVITQENLLLKITKLLLGNNLGEKHTGNKHFDNLFKIHAADEEKLKSFVTEAVTTKILNFMKENPTIYGIHGKLTLFDNRLTYKEGPYYNSPSYKDDNKFKIIIDDLVELARLI